MNLEDIKWRGHAGPWLNLWSEPSVAALGREFGYTEEDITSALACLAPVYDHAWLRNHARHPIVGSLYAPHSYRSFLQVIDLGHALASFPALLTGKRGRQTVGGLQSKESFYPTEYEVRVLARLSRMVSSVDLGGPAARMDARVTYKGATYDVEVFRKDWPDYGKGLVDLAAKGTRVDWDCLTVKELERLRQELYERLKKVDSRVPMVYICSPSPHLMVWLTVNRAQTPRHAQQVASALFERVRARITDAFKERLTRVAKLVFDIPGLVFRDVEHNPDYKNHPSEWICCNNPYHVSSA